MRSYQFAKHMATIVQTQLPYGKFNWKQQSIMKKSQYVYFYLFAAHKIIQILNPGVKYVSFVFPEKKKRKTHEEENLIYLVYML